MEVARLAGGISIQQYFRDHNPPHFHAIRGDEEILLLIADLSVYRGSLNRRALAAVRAWANDRRGPLALNWIRAMQQMPIERIS